MVWIEKDTKYEGKVMGDVSSTKFNSKRLQRDHLRYENGDEIETQPILI